MTIRRKTTRYVIVGILNTIFGYFSTIILLYALNKVIGTVITAVIANIINITFSFILYKIFVFQSDGKWVPEYLRSYIVYGVAAIISIISLSLLIDMMKIEIWIAQGISMSIVVVFSYFGHDHFTFMKRPSKPSNNEISDER